jgi:molybdate transport system ATP-binding protein
VIELSFAIAAQQGEFAIDLADDSSVEVLGLFGPSGAGKTTMLEMIAGLRTPARGHIRIGPRTLFDAASGVNLAPRHRRIGYVPQDVLLFPHLDVQANLLYGAEKRGADDTFRHCVEILEIASLLRRRVQTLSGGERQRVAIGRALMTRPALLLLDEPLAGVDRARRERILPYLLRIRRELHVPLVYVTHDVDEMMQIADRVLIVEEGRVAGRGAPVGVLTRRG